jgi:hypothetical protein
MFFSPGNSLLYRRLLWAVTCLGLLAVVVPATRAQYVRRTRSKGPRALGLLELAPNGKAHLIPITIMVEGKFYDAGAYKASPVPMALEGGTVYEAERTGVSQGLFTVRGVRQLKDAWIGEGEWQVAGSQPAQVARKAEDKPIMGDENDAPPTLRHGTVKPKSEDSAPASAPSPPSSTPQASTGNTVPTTPSASTPSSPSSAPAAAPGSSKDSSSEAEDPNVPHPVLRRGKTSGATQADEIKTPSSAPTKEGMGSAVASKTATATTAVTAVQLIPAISDADGPDPRPYTYDAKPEEVARFQKLMLGLASAEVTNRAKLVGGVAEAAKAARANTRSRISGKGPQPSFDDIQFKIFDLSNTNEPTLVLTAVARMPQQGFTSGTAPGLEYFVTVVGRMDINEELHKIFASTTDNRHLDVISRLELVDAVDADGDGRGELLFREVSDAGTNYVVYRATPDQLWALFDGGRPEE